MRPLELRIDMKWELSVESFRIDFPSHPTRAKRDLIRFKGFLFSGGVGTRYGGNQSGMAP